MFKLLGVHYDNISFNAAVKRVEKLLKSDKKSNLFYFNADCLYKSQKDKEYRDILNSADLVLPDGIALALITRLFGGRMKDNLNGTDFLPSLMKKAAELKYKMYFLGGRKGVAVGAAEAMMKKVPGIEIVGAHNGYFVDDQAVIDKINASGADILFVAMGVPLQEKWIFKYRAQLNPKLCVGVGALFDYLSGRVKRAPKIFRILRLEWLWRVFIEPKRMFKRYFIDGAKLIWMVLKERYGVSRIQSVTGSKWKQK
ncbi:MAG: WecB/TagA/CpsF family glycosyltransferase [Candidatus Omnitrophota bacterium]